MTPALSKRELNQLCDTAVREDQMAQLDAWGIPFELTLQGNIKVLRSDLKWAAERRQAEVPDYDAA